MTTRNADLAVVLRAPLDRLRSDLEKATGRMNNVFKEWQRNMRGAGQRLESIGKTLSLRLSAPIAGVAAGLFMLANNAGKLQDALLNLGISGDQFADLKQATKDAGLNTQGLVDSLQALGKAMGEARDTGETPEAFRKLGVEFFDAAGNMRPVKEIMAEIIVNLGNINDPLDKTRLAMAALGSGGDELAMELSEPSQRIAEMKERLEELKTVLAGVTLKFVKLPLSVQMGILAFGFLLFAIGPVVTIFTILGALVGVVAAFMGVSMLAAGVIIATVVAGIIAIVFILITRWDEVKAEWIAGWTQIGEFMGMILEKIVGFFKENWAKILGILFPPVGIAMLVAENWGKIVGVVTGIFDSAVAVVKSAVNQIIDLINSVISAWNSLEFGVGPFTVGVGEFKRTFGPWRFGTPDLPLIPKLAEGGEIVRGGMAIVGDAGRELLDMPRGARVTPLPAGAGVGGGGPYFDLRGAAIYDADGLERLVGRMGANVIRHGGWPRLSRGR